jgi:hypothetical protein
VLFPAKPAIPSARLTSTVTPVSSRRTYTSGSAFVSAGTSAASLTKATAFPSALIDGSADVLWAGSPAGPLARLTSVTTPLNVSLT